MRIPTPLGRLLCAAALALPLGLLPAQADAQTCTTKTECLDRDIDLFDDPPSVSIPSPGATVNTARHRLTFYFGDDVGLQQATATYSVSPGTFAGTATWSWNKAYTSASAQRTVDFAPGQNTVIASICDTKSQCRADTLQVFYNAPPPPPARAAPILSSARSGDQLNLACDGCSDVVLSYSTPAYTSLDQARSVTLFYSSVQARPLGNVEVDVIDNSVEAPVKMSIQVTNPWGYVVVGETFYQAGTGVQRLAGQFDAGGYGTSAKVHTVRVRSYWSDGSFLESTLPVRVIIVDQRPSRFGAGWSMQGLQRLYVQPDGVLLVDGSSAVFFEQTPAGTFVSPPGERTQLGWGASGYVRTYPDGTRAEFGGDGYLLRTVDRFGSQFTYQWMNNYEGIPVPYRITDPAGLVTEFAYHTATGSHYGKLASIRDPGGRTTYFGYWDGWHNLTDVQDAAGGSALRVTYDGAAHLATGWTDARGGRWDVAYDHTGRLARLEAPVQTDGATSGRQVTTIRPREAAVLAQPGYGGSGAPSPRVRGDTVQVAVTAPTGEVTRIRTDAFGLATRIVTPTDTVVIHRNTRGQVTAREDGNGNAVQFDYEEVHPWRLVRTVLQGPDGAVSQSLEYGAYSQTSRVSYSTGVTYDYVLDALGLRTAVKRGATTLHSFTYDARGRVLSYTDPGGHTTSRTYQPAPGTQNLATVTANGVTTQYRYDGLGRRVQTVAAGVAGDSVGFDVLNRITRVRDAAGNVTTLGYQGSAPDVYEVVDPLTQRYQSLRNTLGQVVQSIDPAGASLGYAYSPATGQVTRITNRRGGATTLEYDARGRLVRRVADGVATTLAYDADGRWVAAANPVSTDTVMYDSDGKVTESVTWRGGLRFTVRHTYTAENRPDSVVLGGPWGTRSYLYSYDAVGRLDGLRDLTGKWTHIKLNADGLPDSVRLPTAAAMRLSFGFTPEHRLAWTSAPSGVSALRHGYRYSTRGLVLEDSIATGYGMENFYSYDALDRVSGWELHRYGQRRVCYNIRECYNEPTDDLVQSASFAWDAVGNPAGAGRGAGNRLLSHAGYAMTYDVDGNLTRKYNASGFDQYFTWSAQGQLTGVGRTGQGWVTYDYDGFGRRIRRVDQSTGAVVHYVYDGDDLAMEVDGAGNLLREYAYYPGIDDPHSMRQWANGEGGAIYYYALQQPGHVNGLVNANDQLVNSYRYTPFGAAATGFPVQGTVNPLQYMARELDAATGLYYVRNRWYDPQVGRFISEDPIGLAGGLNLYTYVHNNPLSFRDPLGLCVEFTKATNKQHIQVAKGVEEYCPILLDDITVVAGGNSGGGGGGHSGGGPPGMGGGGVHPGGGSGGGAGGDRMTLSDLCMAVLMPPPDSESGPVLFLSLGGTAATPVGGGTASGALYLTWSGDFGYSTTVGAAAGADMSIDLHGGAAWNMATYSGLSYGACGGAGTVGGCVGGNSNGLMASGGLSFGVPTPNGSVNVTVTRPESLRRRLANAVCR